MKKIVITINRGWIARNLLQNDFYKIVREKYKILILTSAANDTRFLREFGHPNVSFLPLEEKDHTMFDRIFFFLHKNLIYNGTVEQKNRWGILGDARSRKPSYVNFIIKKIIFTQLSKLHFLRDLVRFLDNLFLQKEEVAYFAELLKREKADLVISTNVAADTDAALIKAAKKMNIKTLGIPKSWDNLSKHGFRAKADILAVWSEFMASEAKQFQNYPMKDVRIVGIPQFDPYADRSRLWSREKFCQTFGFDPDRRIIFFGSEGNTVQSDTAIAALIYEGVENQSFTKPTELLIRPHYGYKDDELKFKNLFDKSNVVIDLFNNPSDGFRDSWDYSEEFSDRFLNCLYHIDIMISSYSTLSLDAVAFDRPVINVAFDGKELFPYEKSVARWGEVSYFRELLNTQAVSDVKNADDLKNIINNYLENPKLLGQEREDLRRKFCFKIDGKSGERFSKVVDEMLEK